MEENNYESISNGDELTIKKFPAATKAITNGVFWCIIEASSPVSSRVTRLVDS